MVAPVAVVEGPFVGTTWSRVQPALVGPGTTLATPDSVGEGEECVALFVLWDYHLVTPLRPDKGGESSPVPRVAAMDASFDWTGGRPGIRSASTDTPRGIGER